MNTLASRLRISLLIALVSLGLAGGARADPPSRVARLAYTSGAISFSPGGEEDWVKASVNRPLTTGDRVWADAGARAELQLGDLAIRMGANTSTTLLNLDDHAAQVQLAQGSLNLRVRQLDRDETVEIDTPNLAFSIRRPGSYRVEVDADGTATEVTVLEGEAEVAGDGNAFQIRAGQVTRFYGNDLRDYENLALTAPSDFDRWSSERDRRWENSPSARYVSRDLIGYEDLDEHGSWRNVEGYGNVWSPRGVAADWAPYRDGHWAWVEPWGWTWEDDAPWGFAPSHYGRWAHIGGSWGWVPGPIAARQVYAPALVAFVGGSNFQISISAGRVGAVAWFPLGPRDVFRPSYPVSREYFGRVNSGSTVINTTNITNVYNNTNVTNIVYVNQQVTGAVVAVPRATFAQSRPVAREAVAVSREAIAGTAVVAVAAVAPLQTSVLGAAATPQAKPPQAASARPVVARTAPPPAPVSFAARQGALTADPGRPLDAAAAAAVKPTTAATPAARPQVSVVAAAPAVALPSRPASAAGATGSRPERPAAPPQAAQTAQTAASAPPAPAAQRPQQPVPASPPSAAPPSNAREPAAREARPARPPSAAPRSPEVDTPAAVAPAVAASAAPAAAPAPNNVARPPATARPVPAPREADPRQAEPRVPVPRPPAAVPRPPATAPPPAPAATPVPAPSPAQRGAAEPRGPRPAAEPARAVDRREAASDAKRDEDPRKRNEPEPGRRP